LYSRQWASLPLWGGQFCPMPVGQTIVFCGLPFGCQQG
jgi:hypothetical protein